MKTFAEFFITLSAMVLMTACGKLPKAEIKVSGVSLNKSELSLTVGDSETLTAVFTPSDATNKNVTWSSDYPTAATVDATGKVSAVKAGKATIKVETDDGGYIATCSITVKAGAVAVTGVKFETSEVTVAAEDQRTLTLSFTPSNATNKNVTWSSSNKAVATIDATGRMIAVKEGTTVITVSTQDGGKEATCKVTVEASDPNNLLRTAYIPDPVFLDYCLKQMGEWDKNKDGKLYANEVAAVTSIDVANIYGNAISSLKGIEYFTGITYLDCSLNNLTSLDVSKCTRLTELYCNNNNRLSSLNISGYTALTTLNCSSCSLNSLDVSGCTRLVYLSCFFNELTSLDVSKSTNLNYLDVEGNQLTSLDVTKNRSLKGLMCNNNQLTSLNVSECTELTSLDIDNNRLTSLNMSGNRELIFLSCDMNQLTSLDVSKNIAMESLICNSNEISSIAISSSNAKLKRILSSNNRLNSNALNAVFESLPFSGSIAIHNNPGTSTCNVSIAENKNWTVAYR